MSREEIEKRMAEIRERFIKIDYKNFKKLRDQLSDEEWINHVEECDALTKEYNELEALLNS